MKIEFENIILRDMIESDIEDYVRWFTVEREWENWDAPWEKEDTNEEEQRREWKAYYDKVKNRPDEVFRWRLEIEWNGRHIGWCSSYKINKNYEWTAKDTAYRAVGIDICEPDARGKGIGSNALRAFINHHFADGVVEHYTQTWSGNVRMIRCAEKLGFVECNRETDFREVNGQKYDGLTLRLEKI